MPRLRRVSKVGLVGLSFGGEWLELEPQIRRTRALFVGTRVRPSVTSAFKRPGLLQPLIRDEANTSNVDKL
jgi:hypothetical protein